MNEESSIFEFVKNQLKGKLARIITIKSIYTGRISYVDTDKNISLLVNGSYILLQRKYIVSLECPPLEERLDAK